MTCCAITPRPHWSGIKTDGTKVSVAYVIYVGIPYLPLSLVSLPNLEQQGQDFLTLCVIKPQFSGNEQRKEGDRSVQERNMYPGSCQKLGHGLQEWQLMLSSTENYPRETTEIPTPNTQLCYLTSSSVSVSHPLTLGPRQILCRHLKPPANFLVLA